MDPTATLMEIRSIIAGSENGEMAKSLQEIEDEHHRLCELIDALDNWISKGGFLPEDWEKQSANKRKLLDLLAVIHRDGGHRTGAVGLEQSCKEAMSWASDVHGGSR